MRSLVKLTPYLVKVAQEIGVAFLEEGKKSDLRGENQIYINIWKLMLKKKGWHVEKPKFLLDSEGMNTQKRKSGANNLLYTNHKRGKEPGVKS